MNVTRTNVTRPNVSRNVPHTNVSHTTTTTTTRFHRTNVTNHTTTQKLTHQQVHTNTGLRPPLKKGPTFQPPPKAIQAEQLHNRPTFQPPPKAVQAAQIHNQLQRGPGPIGAIKGATVPGVRLANNRFAPIWKGPHRIWWGDRWRVFVPFTALSAVVVAGHYYYPDSYVGFAQPYCAGVTPDGCQLNWQQVNFEDGGSDWQCVQYCPRPNALPPPQAITLAPQPPAPPEPPQGACEVTIFPDQNFGGNGVTTGDEQPALSQSGWQNQIASIQVKTGTWDFFSDENYGGQAMRLAPGPYQDLGPEWTKKIGSFHCVQPGQ